LVPEARVDGHAADGCVGAGIDGEEQPHVAQMLVELLAGDARLHDAVEILGMDGDDAFIWLRSTQTPP
jgi:hypothetical protein